MLSTAILGTELPASLAQPHDVTPGDQFGPATSSAFAGPPNPNDPGEQEFAVPFPRRNCGTAAVLASRVGGWMNGVYPFSGEVYHVAVDMRVRGRQLDFIWARKYRSKGGPDSPMGHRWDHTYNIYVEARGPDLLLHNGFARADRYRPQEDGTWIRPEFFRVITEERNGTFTLTFPGTGTWSFHALDGSPIAGKLRYITERNGNMMELAYDGDGLLTTVTDDLGREYQITYNVHSQIQAVTDFTGRTVTYEYYGDDDPDGGPGDLKSVTSPAVTGTPRGNDYPDGKTTVYTYSVGRPNERLNHLLLTTTDPKDQTYLTNEYAATTHPRDLEFGRVVRQTWGDPGDVIDLFYVPQTPGPENNFAAIKVILNDREGHVKECFYDRSNYGAMCREFTGLADPDLPTTETENRPTDRLRPNDPNFFETRWRYNRDGLPTRVVFPNLNSTLLAFDEANGDRRLQGNLLERRREPGPLGGDQPELVETFEYAPGFGCSCGLRFVTRYVDGRGNEMLNDYDDNGNRIHTQHRIPSIQEDWEYDEQFGQLIAHTWPGNGSGYRRRDEFTYYEAGPWTGYLQNRIVDANGFALTTTWEYNDRGAVTAIIDPRGSDTQLIRNQLDQVVRRLSREVTTPNGPVRYERDYFYDADDNLVRVDVRNVNAEGQLQDNEHFSTVRDVEILNRVTRVCRERGSYDVPDDKLDCVGLPATGEFITERYEYTDNRVLTMVRSGEAVNGNEPDNKVKLYRDERDKLFRRIRAAWNPDDRSTTRYDYDQSGNLTVTRSGTEGVDRVTVRTCDGYDRITSRRDPMFNLWSYSYDGNGNLVGQRLDGELADVDGGAGNVRLEETAYVYDPMNRQTRIERAFFNPATQEPIDDGLSVTETEWTGASQVKRVIDDNGHPDLVVTYDTALRPLQVADAVNNTRTFTYDLNSNVTSVVAVDRSDLDDHPDQEFTTSYGHDELDRLINTTDNIGNVRQQYRNSRGLRELAINARGKEVRRGFDGAGRLVWTARDMNDNGADPNDPNDIVTRQSWDDNRRLVSQTDDNGNVTAYEYNLRNLLTHIDYADETESLYTYNVHDDVITTRDANGTVVDTTYDRNGRIETETIDPGEGVSDDTTFQTWAYDGRGLVVSGEDDDSLVTVTWNSLGDCNSETLNGQITRRTFDGVGNKLTLEYPGGRAIEISYDVLDNADMLSDAGGTFATFFHVGPRRLERIEYGNDTRMDLTWDGVTGFPNEPDDFGVARISRTTHTRISDSLVLDDRKYKWDQAQNKTYRENLVEGVVHEHEYDSISRLVSTLETPSGESISYALDGLGNRTEVTGVLDPGTYFMDDTLPEPADAQMNQYTTTSFDGRHYDKNGNLVDIDQDLPEQRNLESDYANRLVAYHDLAAGVDAFYRYDCFGRRIEKTVVSPLSTTTVTRSFFDIFFEIEHQDDLGNTTAAYAWAPPSRAGLFLDGVEIAIVGEGGPWTACGFGGTSGAIPIAMGRGPDVYFYHCNDLGSVTALTDGAGQLVERYAYRDYGETLIFDAQGEPIEVSAVGNPYTYKSMRFDDESGLHYTELRCPPPPPGAEVDKERWYVGPSIIEHDYARDAMEQWVRDPSRPRWRPWEGPPWPWPIPTRWDAGGQYLDTRAGRYVTRATATIWGDPHVTDLGNPYTACANNPWSAVDRSLFLPPGTPGLVNVPPGGCPVLMLSMAPTEFWTLEDWMDLLRSGAYADFKYRQREAEGGDDESFPPRLYILAPGNLGLTVADISILLEFLGLVPDDEDPECYDDEADSQGRGAPRFYMIVPGPGSNPDLNFADLSILLEYTKADPDDPWMSGAPGSPIGY